MELALSLGDTTKQPPFSFLDKTSKISSSSSSLNKDLGFCCMGLSVGFSDEKSGNTPRTESSSDPSLKLHSLNFSPVFPTNHHRFPWLTQNLPNNPPGPRTSGLDLDVNRAPPSTTEPQENRTTALSSSPSNSAASSLQLEFGIRTGVSGGEKPCSLVLYEGETERTSSRTSDEDENGSTRKKLRLSKDQSAFLEESFKEHNTLNPKQKLGLAKQLNLRPRQVEVWFQNRRARTKLKQTEVDCEYLKRCCETLTEENRRLQKEVQELRALKSSQPYYMHLPATTLTMCPSCERTTTTTTTTTTSAVSAAAAAARD